MARVRVLGGVLQITVANGSIGKKGVYSKQFTSRTCYPTDTGFLPRFRALVARYQKEG